MLEGENVPDKEMMALATSVRSQGHQNKSTYTFCLDLFLIGFLCRFLGLFCVKIQPSKLKDLNF